MGSTLTKAVALWVNGAAWDKPQGVLMIADADGRLGTLETGVAAEITNRTNGENTLTANLAAETTRATGAENAETTRAMAIEAAFPMIARQTHRPGESVLGFTQSLAGGDPALLPRLPISLITFADAGFVARVTGAAIVAERSLRAIEPGRLYKVRFVVQRRVDTTDPSNDGVVLAIAWYDQAHNALAGASASTQMQTLTAFTTGSGRTEVFKDIARAAGTLVDFVAPAGAIYARAFVQTFGNLCQTDVEICTVSDISDQTTTSVDVTATNARVAAIESLNLGARTTALESAVTAPNSLSYPTQGAAVAATVPATVLVVRLLGKSTAGDGDGGDYVKVGSSAPGGFTSANGLFFARITRFSAFDVALLPTTLPAVAGIWWLDGGSLSVSQ